MKTFYFCFILLLLQTSCSRPAFYTVSNAHSHNDYENNSPFWTAYNAGFGSIEADIFLHSNQLLVAHSKKELGNKRTLEALYLKPLDSSIKKGNSFVYPDTSRQLQLLIDVKTDSIATLQKLINVLKNYPRLTSSKSLKIVITGRQPLPQDFPTYPSYIFFDGNVGTDYTDAELAKTAMLSSAFKNYSSWKGVGDIPEKDKAVLKAAINKAHKLHKPIRFWGVPDGTNAWEKFMQLKVDFINTDKINALSSYLQKR